MALELGLDVAWVDTTSDAGQAALRSLNPVWKVPAARLDGQIVLDSAWICRELIRRHGPGPLAPPESWGVEVSNAMAVIDGALDALINSFYLAKDGVGATGVAYLQKQHQRAHSSLGWLEERVRGPWVTGTQQFGLPEIALVSALDWMEFREVYEVQQHPALAACLAHHRERPSLSATSPAAG